MGQRRVNKVVLFTYHELFSSKTGCVRDSVNKVVLLTVVLLTYNKLFSSITMGQRHVNKVGLLKYNVLFSSETCKSPGDVFIKVPLKGEGLDAAWVLRSLIIVKWLLQTPKNLYPGETDPIQQYSTSYALFQLIN